MVHVFCKNFTESQIIISGNDAHHLRDVLRMHEGEDIFVSDGAGRNVLATIREFSEDGITCDIISEKAAETELDIEIVLYQALPKSDKMESVIQKCVELGASRIVPIETSRCIVKLDAKGKAKKIERWQKIAESAAKQSQRDIIPEISEVMSLDEAIQDAQKLSECVIAYEMEDSREGLKSLLRGSESVKRESIGIFIGPEGGFEFSEVEKARGAGIKSISLGRRILRTETAGMAIVAAIMLEHEIGGADE